MVILGLSGSAGVGKSTVAKMFSKHCRAAIFDADKEVHDMYTNDVSIINLVREYFPDSVLSCCISRKELAKHFFCYSQRWQRFQAVVHESLLQRQKRFIQESIRKKYDYVILDVPLLVEKGFHRICNYVIHVCVSRSIQYRRLALRGIPKKRIDFLLSLQIRDEKRNFFSDFCINTGYGINVMSSTILGIIRSVGRR